MYKENINLNGVAQNLQLAIMDGSGGHAASFMILLKLYDVSSECIHLAYYTVPEYLEMP